MRAVHLFVDADLRCGHKGLNEIATKAKIDIRTLKPGDAIVFINSAKTKMKAYCCNDVVSYVRSGKGINLSTLNAFTDAISPGTPTSLTPAFRNSFYDALGIKTTKIKSA